MNNSEMLAKDLNKETVHHTVELCKIADKHGIDVIELIIADCTSSTASLIDMGYGDRLIKLTNLCKNIK